MRRLGKLAVAAAMAFMSAGLAGHEPAAAQDWPQRPVRLILPLGPGSGVDITARLLAEQLTAKWGQPVVVENRPGGDGVVAVSAFTNARDDHMLLVSPTSSFTHHPWTQEKLPYDPKDLVPIVRTTNTIVGVVVPASSPINSVADLVETARKQPGKLNWATITGMFDFVFEGFQRKEKLQIARVPYKNTVQAATDLSEGRIDLMMVAFAIVRSHVEAGRVKLVAVTSAQRAPIVPNAPTPIEAGFPDLVIEGLVGVFGTPSLPAKARERIAADVTAVLKDPAIAKKLEATGQVVNPGGTAEFAEAIERQRAQVAGVGKLLGIKPAQ